MTTHSTQSPAVADLSFPAATVSDVMHPGVVSCPPEAQLAEVAGVMARNTIHFVVVHGLAAGARGDEHLVWGAISALDLVKAGAADVVCTAGEFASTELVSVDSGDSLLDAARRMLAYEVSHALVVDPASRTPVGIVSTLDLVRALANGGAA